MPEVVDDPAFADLPDPDTFGFGTGLAEVGHLPDLPLGLLLLRPAISHLLMHGGEVDLQEARARLPTVLRLSRLRNDDSS